MILAHKDKLPHHHSSTYSPFLLNELKIRRLTGLLSQLLDYVTDKQNLQNEDKEQKTQ